ncbi:UDP-N-acetylglucosamine 2-epimerase [Thioclava sp. L04-15]|uniref:non-hydrolyzing UDP-N-acetylglucosamine 2-epimerase n=1 Tax=Thioclava sp. L04-15 TaxID=1915318 RepID=UPI0009966A1A|nr:UDP-N-acetylglucosamine 2-epimerase (non-hydrolyzing) [Thioclava sp. L04-15]OOY27827.1 UDP-N-acetylglucosamine 2-epimerase [Thioclava sp. L04-15]
MKVLLIIGTRPEAIKLAPVYRALEARDDITTRLVLTGQHRDMARGVLELFGVAADIDLDVMKPSQTLTTLSARISAGLARVIEEEAPSSIVVQGDTTSAMIGAIMGFYAGCRVAHVEAGLRTGNMSAPFPEEFNRRVITLGAYWHFAPTREAADNLTRENVSANIHVVGNTVIDAAISMSKIMTLGKKKIISQLPFLENSGRKTILITVHRRENIGSPMENISDAVAELADKYPDFDFVVPVHPNPVVGSILRPRLESKKNVHLVAPLDYDQMVHVITKSHLILTDSGGIQEEAPAFNVPVLVLRNETERMEGVEAGCSRIVGTDRVRIVSETERLLMNSEGYAKMAQSRNPYGQGNASEAIAQILSLAE